MTMSIAPSLTRFSAFAANKSLSAPTFIAASKAQDSFVRFGSQPVAEIPEDISPAQGGHMIEHGDNNMNMYSKGKVVGSVDMRYRADNGSQMSLSINLGPGYYREFGNSVNRNFVRDIMSSPITLYQAALNTALLAYNTSGLNLCPLGGIPSDYGYRGLLRIDAFSDEEGQALEQLGFQKDLESGKKEDGTVAYIMPHRLVAQKAQALWEKLTQEEQHALIKNMSSDEKFFEVQQAISQRLDQ